MYPACLWSWAPGHNGYPHAPVLITTIGLMGQFWVQAEGTSFDCSAILFCSAQTGDEIHFCQSQSMAVGSEGRRRRSSSLAPARRLSIAIMLWPWPSGRARRKTAPPMLFWPACWQERPQLRCDALAFRDHSSISPAGGFLVGHV